MRLSRPFLRKTTENDVSDLPVFEEMTDGILVQVTPAYLNEQSDPSEGHYVWAYQVRMINQGRQTVQLLTRRWRITDANGRVHEVIGDGVVGEKPVLRPGDSYQYSSGTPLSTSSGFMAGVFQVVDTDGKRFAVRVPTFSLDGPEPRGIVH